jgi:hypothetical protein
MKTYYGLLLLTVVFALTACSTVTKISAAWKAPDYQGGAFKQILVIGVGRDESSSRLFEETFAKALSAKGAVARPIYTVLPDPERLTEDEIKQAMQQGQDDAVIITRLLAVNQDTQYVPPRTYTVPRLYYGYYGYYHSAWNVVHEPGYLRTATVVRLETNLYAARTGQLVWSGRSDTFDPTSTKDTIDSVTKAVAQRLAKEGLVGR